MPIQNQKLVTEMAKYLKANEIKVGMTIYIVHPEFKWIEKCYVTKRPYMKFEPILNKKVGLIFEYKEITLDLDGNISSNKVFENHYYLSDAGVPNKDGVFGYKQHRRAFPTLSAAQKYWKDKQDCPDFKRSLAEKADWEFFDDFFSYEFESI